MKFSFKLEEIKYVKLAFKDNEGYTENVKAAIKKIDDKEILICSKFENGLEITTPQEIEFSVICNDGLYKTKTILKSIDNEEPYVFFILETPVGIEYQQNREYFRVPTKYNCIYKISTENGYEEYKTTTEDISANGVSLFLPNHIISESLAEIIININEIQIVVGAKYIRSEKIENGYRISFSFARISELDRDYISQVCIKKQLEQKRNSIR